MSSVHLYSKARFASFNYKKSIAAFVFTAAFFCITTLASAASLYLTPSATRIEKGATFTVAVKVDTQGKTINVVEATMGFPSDKLAIVKVTPSATFSIQSPGSPRITKSQVAFSSGIPSPGYLGQSGTIGTVTFRALAPGTVTLSVDSGQVLLNDGLATTIQTQKKNSTITIVGTTAPIVEPVIPVVQENDLIIEEPVPEPIIPAPVPAEVVSEVKTGGDVVTTITIRVKDLVRIIYVLAILLGIFIIISLYLFVTNINLRHKNKEMREMSKL